MSGIGTREISLTKEIGGSWGGVWPQSFWTSNWHNLFERHSSANRDKLKGGWERKKFTDNPIDWTKSEAYLTTKRCEYKYISKKWETSEEKRKMINMAIPCAWLHLLMGYWWTLPFLKFEYNNLTFRVLKLKNLWRWSCSQWETRFSTKRPACLTMSRSWRHLERRLLSWQRGKWTWKEELRYRFYLNV